MTFFTPQETLQTLLSDCQKQITTTYGLDLLSVRCLHTGAPIGFFDESIFLSALADEGALDDAESDDDLLDIESLADALLVRSLASARPSPALNRPTTQSLKRLMQSNPTLVCAFLLNRYHLSDWRKLNHRSDSWFSDMLHRVKVWETLNRLDDSSDQFESPLRTLCHWLLELDSKCNLHELTPPSDWFAKFRSIDSLDLFDLFAREFALFAAPIIAEADKRFSVGNRLATSAFVQSWFDNPALAQRKVEIANNKRQRLYDKYGSVAIGQLLEADKQATRKANQKRKAEQDSRIIKGRSARSKAAKLVNKHSDKLDSLFKSLDSLVIQPSKPKPQTKSPVGGNGLPKF